MIYVSNEVDGGSHSFHLTEKEIVQTDIPISSQVFDS